MEGEFNEEEIIETDKNFFVRLIDIFNNFGKEDVQEKIRELRKDLHLWIYYNRNA